MALFRCGGGSGGSSGTNFKSGTVAISDMAEHFVSCSFRPRVVAASARTVYGSSTFSCFCFADDVTGNQGFYYSADSATWGSISVGTGIVRFADDGFYIKVPDTSVRSNYYYIAAD